MKPKHVKMMSTAIILTLLPTLVLYELRFRLLDALCVGFACLCFYLAVIMVVSPKNSHLPPRREMERRPPIHYDDEYEEEYTPFQQSRSRRNDARYEGMEHTVRRENEVVRKNVVRYRRNHDRREEDRQDH